MGACYVTPHGHVSSQLSSVTIENDIEITIKFKNELTTAYVYAPVDLKATVWVNRWMEWCVCVCVCVNSEGSGQG